MPEKKISLRKTYDLVENEFLPRIYKAEIDAVACYEKRKAYECFVGAGDHYSAILESYLGCEQKKKKVSTALATVNKNMLVKVKRSFLAEYRQQHGLDKLALKIKQAIVGMASFDEGLQMISNHLALLGRKDLGQIIFYRSQKLISKGDDLNKFKVELFYPNLTADEVMWLSLTSNPRKKWLLDDNSKLFWPPSLIEMNLEGLVFAHGTIFDESSNTNDYHFRLSGGVTGVDDESDTFLFLPNVREAFKALVLLSLNDEDLFLKIWNEEDIIPTQRGDDMLIRAFVNFADYGIESEHTDLSLQDLVWEAGNNLDKETINLIRRQIGIWYNKCQFACDQVRNLGDFVKLIGMLEKTPNFILEQNIFNGFITFYKGEVNFIDANGIVTETIPLVGHLRNIMAYQFHKRMVEVDRIDSVLREVFSDLCLAISQKNIDEGNQMPIDAMQVEIFDKSGIFVSQQSYCTVAETDRFEFLFSTRGISNKYKVVTTVKFSFDELCWLVDIVTKIPVAFLKNINFLRKKSAYKDSFSDLYYGHSKVGELDPKQKTITLTFPTDTPGACLFEDSMFEFALAKFNGRLKSFYEKSSHDALKAEVIFFETIVHEIGESVYINFPKVKQAWLELIKKIPKKVLREEKAKYFLTAYATSDPNEDFAETFCKYVVFGKSFRDLTKYEFIKQKYEFMHNLFSLFGRTEKFEDMFLHGMYCVSARPDIDINEKFDEEGMREDFWCNAYDNYIAGQIGSSLRFSYDEVAEKIIDLEDGDQECSYEDASRIIGQDKQESAEYFAEKLFVRASAYEHLERMFYQSGLQTNVLIDVLKPVFYNLVTLLVNFQWPEAIKMVTSIGMKEKDAKIIITKLKPFVKKHADLIEERLNEILDVSTEDDNPLLGKIIAEIAGHKKKQ